MKNIHLLDEPTDEVVEQIVNDSTLNPTARFILIHMIANKDKHFNESIIRKEHPMFNLKDVQQAFELLVTTNYLKRVISKEFETHFYLSFNEFEKDIGLFN
ncbi:hypothetical protein [Psychroserpens mesophilus]|uniref:hypothetical protein n=1 Tax=Psychroserpens mesophilus TaxID=325473 RepID=UPI003D658E15